MKSFKNLLLLRVVLSMFLFLLMSSAVRSQTLVTGPLNSPGMTGEYYHPSSITLSAGFTSNGPFRAYITSVSDCSPLVFAPSGDQNYVVVNTIKADNVTDASNLLGRNTCEVNQVIQYFDGLGRPLQTIQVQGSPGGKDVIQPVVYDPFGRESIKYLPYSDPATGGSFRSGSLSAQGAFYTSPPSGVVSTAFPFSETLFEASPLGRVVQQGAPGAVWQLSGGHTARTEYGTNGANSVMLFTAAAGSLGYDRVLGSAGFYGAGELYLTIQKDENWTSGKSGTMEEYKDKSGKVVLKRVWQDESLALSTYYVYDDLDNLSFVLPPGALPDSGVPNVSALENFSYQYRYDQRRRIMEKWIPGKSNWEQVMYNKLDQVVFTRDAGQVARGERTYTKYDGLGRVIKQGYESGSESRIELQATLNSGTVFWESRDSAGPEGYTNVSYPGNVLNMTTQVVNYYDNYAFGDSSLVAAANPVSQATHGLLTGSKVYQTNGTNPLLTGSYYDSEGLLIEAVSQNHLAGTDRTVNTWNFAKELTGSTRTHVVNNLSTTISKGFTYDHWGRKLKSIQNINGAGAVDVSGASYNEIGQLRNKNLHHGLQQIDYRYNERGWLTGINEPGSVSAAKAFGMELNYANNPGAFNGNIGSVSWQTQVPAGLGLSQALRSYEYTYDKLNRLTLAAYTAPGQTDHFNEALSYDVMGNIASLQRQSGGSTLNSLGYAYTISGAAGNKLESVTDTGSEGYSSSYTYDPNGNVKTDSKKLITDISYNYLNLPELITRTGGNLTYIYDGNGTKLSKTASGVTRHYIDGIEYSGSVIDFISTEEGRAVNTGGSYYYEYMLKDHLGNTRAAVKQDGSITQVQDYYAFGRAMNPGNSYSTSPANEYKYNGKELQPELEQYDYGARFYDPVIGRWNVVDPLAEKFSTLSPYNYTDNNPVNNTDPDGMDIFYGANSTSYTGADARAIFNSLQNAYRGNDDEDKNKKKKEEVKKGSETKKGGAAEVSISADDPLQAHPGQDRPFTMNEFINANKGLTRDEIVNQTRNRSQTFMNSQEGGPRMRYVKNPHDGKVLDMRHMLIIGNQPGVIGNLVEIGQWAVGRESGMNKQDFYSNSVGYQFYIQRSSLQNFFSPKSFTDQLKTFFSKPKVIINQ